MINKTTYDDKIDNWAVGILTYELLTGAAPFTPAVMKEDRSDLYSNIRESSLMPNQYYDKNVSNEAKDFIGRILENDPMKRYTLLQMVEHSWLD